MKNLKITVNGTAYDVQVEEVGATGGATFSAPVSAPVAAPAGEGEPVNSPMPGTIVSVNVTSGQAVKEGDVLVVLEAMKMENEIMAPKAGTITSVNVNKGDSVEANTLLVTIK